MVFWRTAPQDWFRSFLAKRSVPQSFKILGPLTALEKAWMRMIVIDGNDDARAGKQGVTFAYWP